METGALVRGSAAAALLLLVAGCSTPVAVGLDEDDANRIVVSLDQASIDAQKEAEPGSEGKFRVVVPRDDAARALSTMRDEQLPRPRPAGVLDAVNKSALVPSQAQEHAELVAGMAGDLERSLEQVDGVLSARVHLNVPATDPLQAAGSAAPRATASVLFFHRGSSPPLTQDAVQRLVAGGVPGLSPADVAVVAVSRPAPPSGGAGASSSLAHVGPIAVARGSLHALQIGLALLVALVALFAGATLALYTRLVRLRDAAAVASPAGASPPRT